MNKKLIKIAHVVAISAIALGAAIAGQRNLAVSGQNSNRASDRQNGNANRQGGNTSDNMNRQANDNTDMTDRTNANSGQNANSGNMNRGAGGNTNASGGMMSGNRNSNTGAGGQTGASGRGATLGSNDRKFVMEAAMGGMMEVELGRLAVERGASEAVKQFGQRMIDDHTRANQELMQLASAAGLTPPAALDAKHQAMVAKMARLSGAEFDRAYARQMVKDHEKTVALFQRESSRGAHDVLKSFAAAQLPALREHLQMARALAAGGTTHTQGTSGAAAAGAPRH
jgi:putative membrane protein